ncbi:ead/Ea22-like family protein [Salmonella enterica subsp. enterica]|nr:ead/Ea22-like family protein [Salmonella enterica subsp. enterica]
MKALNKQALREAAIHAQSSDDWGYDDDNFHDKATPDAVLMLLDELEAAEKRVSELEARAFNPALLDVISERQRQRAVEGWTSEHDDAYQNSELADAAACYAINAHNQGFSTPAHWPWAPEWWKQSGARRDLVKAGALILAEIERLDRAAAGKGE